MKTTVQQLVIYTENLKETVIRITVGDFHKDICVDWKRVNEYAQDGTTYTTEDWNEVSENGKIEVVEMLDDYCGTIDKSGDFETADKAIDFIVNMAFEEKYEDKMIDWLEYLYFTCGDKKYQWLPKEEVEF